MALLASTRREADAQSFPLLIYIFAPILALGLQSFVTLHFAAFAMLDLPLIVVIYFAISRQNPITATIGGAVMGLAQDALTHQPLGVFGIAKAVIGYLAASIGGRVDTESHIARAIMVFLFALLHNGIVWLLVRRLLAQPMGWSWLHEPLRAAINAVVAVVIFALLDRVKVRA